MATPLNCTRCHELRDGLDKPPFRGTLGEKIHASVCHECWAAWQAEQTRMINEYRMSMGDPRAQTALDARMKEFLFGGAPLMEPKPTE